MPDWTDALYDLVTHAGKTAIEHGGHAIAAKTYRKPLPSMAVLAAPADLALPPWRVAEGAAVAGGGLAALSGFPEAPWRGPETAKWHEKALEGPRSAQTPLRDTLAEGRPNSTTDEALGGSDRGVVDSYASEWGEDLSIACTACTRRHLATVAESLALAAASPDPLYRRQQSAIAAGELLVWREFDLTPDKLAKTPKDELAAIAAAMEQTKEIESGLPKAPERLVLAWASAGEAGRFARSANPTAIDERECSVRMRLVEGVAGYYEASEYADRPEHQDAFRQIREARHAWTRDGYTPDTTRAAKEAMWPLVVALTPGVPEGKCQQLADLAKTHSASFQRAVFDRMRQSVAARHAMTVSGPAEPASSVERHSFKGSLVDRSSKVPAAIAQAVTDRPTPLQEALGATPSTEQAFMRLLELAKARGILVRDVPLPTFEDGDDFGAVFGVFQPQENDILLGPQSVMESAKDVYVLAEETAHSLLHGHDCLDFRLGKAGTPYEDLREEREAKSSAFLALMRAGVPLESEFGDPLDPARVEVDVERMQRGMNPHMVRRVEWAASLIEQAIAGDAKGAAKEAKACPV